jgi:hypothetical protein
MLSLSRRALSALVAVALAASVFSVPAAAVAAEQEPAVAEHRWWDDDDDDHADWWDRRRDRDDDGDDDRGNGNNGNGNNGNGNNGKGGEWGPGQRGPWTDLVGFAANNGRGGGYWVLTKDGDVYGLKGAPNIVRKPTRRTIVGIAAHPTRVGYWLVDRQGLVTAHGAARNYGRAHLKAAVGIAAHRSGRGYWVAGKSGSVRALGAAGRYGGLNLSRAFVDRIVPRQDADGYYLHTTADGWRAFPRITQRERERDRTPTTPKPDPQPDPPSTGTVRTRTVYGITVAASIATNVARLMAKSRRDGVSLGGWGYRSTARQIELRRQHCGRTRYAIYQMPSSQCSPPTARPGTSMHEKGLAIDFYKRGRNGAALPIGGTREFRWLQRNARTFGLYNLPSEAWHWSTNGH